MVDGGFRLDLRACGGIESDWSEFDCIFLIAYFDKYTCKGCKVKMARKQCRVWWPQELSHFKPSSDLLLFGWCIHFLNSVDIVLAVVISTFEYSVYLQQEDLQEILRHVDAKMPVALQEISTFSVLGHCVVESSSQNMTMMSNQCIDSSPESRRGKMKSLEVEENAALGSMFTDHMNDDFDKKSFIEASSADYCGGYRCGCKKLDPYMDTQRQALIRHDIWIQLVSTLQGSSCKGTRWIPEFDHIHQSGDMLEKSDFHLIIYDLPAYGRHHYTLSSWDYSEDGGIPFRKPRWAKDLYQKPPLLDLEPVVSALNCSDAAKQLLQRRLGMITPTTHLLLCGLASNLWYVFVISLASISAGLYFIFQSFYSAMSAIFHHSAILILRKAFGHTWKNLHIRSCQILYWPIFLRGSGFSSPSNVEFAHRDALRKHSMWSGVAVDIVLGTVFGVVLLANIKYICFWIMFIAHDITNNLLRSGCVWLMGAPAGFKLNTELAEFFGMVSLASVQTFSTLWFFIGSFLPHFIRGLALSGILFGLTIPAALCIDMLKIVALHVITLHWLISSIYSQQIQALASLWRLFRGRKWNPLRQRLDSYDDYSVGQHVVGSLLFTPLLLLLPTTSVFYIFFTLLSTSLFLICFTIEMIISVLHATPYAEILLWLARGRRFPSGIWFKIISGMNFTFSASNGLPEIGNMTLSSDERSSNLKEETIVSVLHSNYATLGNIVLPCYTRVFRKISPTFNRQMASAILSGRRIPSSLDTDLPSTLPWMHISFRQYWRLCYSSIVGSNLPQ